MCFILGPAPKPIRQRIRGTLTLDFNFHLNSQIRVFKSQGLSNLTSFHHCVKLCVSQAQCLSNSWIQFSLYRSPSAPPISSCFLWRLGRQRNRCPRRLRFCPLAHPEILVGGNKIALHPFPPSVNDNLNIASWITLWMLLTIFRNVLQHFLILLSTHMNLHVIHVHLRVHLQDSTQCMPHRGSHEQDQPCRT